MAPEAHPPTPGSFVLPNLLPVMEALAPFEFPITKAQLLSELEDETVLVGGRNVALRDIIRQVHDDAFDSVEELGSALENFYTRPEGEAMEGGTLPSVPADVRDIYEPPGP